MSIENGELGSIEDIFVQVEELAQDEEFEEAQTIIDSATEKGFDTAEMQVYLDAEIRKAENAE